MKLLICNVFLHHYLCATNYCLNYIPKFQYLFPLGVEKKNDDIRCYFHNKINHWDACRSLLLVEKRQECLQECRRLPRAYNKRNHQFFNEGGKQQAAQKFPLKKQANKYQKQTKVEKVLHSIYYIVNVAIAIRSVGSGSGCGHFAPRMLHCVMEDILVLITKTLIV